MTHYLEILALGVLLLTLPGTLYLAVLSLAGGLPIRPSTKPRLSGRLAIVVPAHNEASGIRRTLENLLALAATDLATQVVVIADNCTDETAEIARNCGARVLERQDALLRGKGYALDFAFQQLLQEDFTAVVVTDADSLAAPNFIDSLRAHFGAGAQALQTRYTVLNPGDTPRTQLAEIALACFNILRPRGRQQLGLSVGILGNGFALRREVLEIVPYTATSVVEDLEYHLQLIAKGYRVEFVDDTYILGDMPSGEQGQNTQRARWEGGRLRMMLDHAPSLAGKVLLGKWRFIDPMLDLLLPPLAYHVLLLGLALTLSIWHPYSLAFALTLCSFAAITLHILVAMHVSDLSWKRLRIIFYLPSYLFWKLRMVVSTLRAARRSSKWIRTDRTGS
jgi:cellulose synthase/poly-beta-1,6-N-acetylglucosamine synthase-like glycosyltransferase